MGSRALHTGYALSGFLSLGFQVLWFRIFSAHFGATGPSFLVVLVGFIGGLCAGAWLSERVERALAGGGARSGLRCYGIIELLVALSLGLTVLLIVGPPAGWTSAFPYVVDGGIHRRPWLLEATLVLAGLGCVALPATLMGTTFPLLCRAYPERPRIPSSLYAANTLGAALGVLATQLLLLPALGQSATLGGLIAANAGLGAYFYWRGGATPRPGLPDRPTAASPASRRPVAGALVAGALAAGFLAGAIEGDLVKRLWFLGATTTAALAFISFAAIVAIFLAACAVHHLPRLRPWQIKASLTAGFGYYLLAWQLGYPLRGWLEGRVALRLDEVPDDLARMQAAVAVATDPLYALVLALAFALPTLTAISTVLPFACNEAQARGGSVGAVYGANTFGFCLGVFAFVWAAPHVSVFYSLNLLPWVGVATVAYLVLWRVDRPPSLGLAVAGAGACALAAATVPPGFDRTLLDPARRAAHLPVRALQSNGAHTTYVVADADGDRLYFDSHPMSGTSLPAQTYMRLMAHLPLLLQEAPRTVLVVGFGVGNTAAGAARHPGVERIDVVELNDRVIATAPEFEPGNDGVHRDPRVRFFHDDGRRFLAGAADRYDLVTSEPPPPVQEGVHRLYSREYYADAAARLSPGGMVSQWLPIAQVPARAATRMVATFRSVFPHTLVVVGHGRDLVLIGALAPFDGSRLVRRLAEPGPVHEDLARLGIRAPEQVLARVVGDAAPPASGSNETRLVSDERNDLAFLSFDPAERAIAYRPERAFAVLGLAAETAVADRRQLARSPGLVQFRVPSFPFDALDLGTTADAHAWARSARLRLSYLEAHRRGARGRADALLDEALALPIAQPWWLREAAEHRLGSGQAERALTHLEALRASVPPEPALRLLEARALNLARRHAHALALLGDRSIALAPSAPFLSARGDALAGLGRDAEALTAYHEALRHRPDFLPAARALAALVARMRSEVK